MKWHGINFVFLSIKNCKWKGQRGERLKAGGKVKLHHTEPTCTGFYTEMRNQRTLPSHTRRWLQCSGRWSEALPPPRVHAVQSRRHPTAVWLLCVFRPFSGGCFSFFPQHPGDVLPCVPTERRKNWIETMSAAVQRNQSHCLQRRGGENGIRKHT